MNDLDTENFPWLSDEVIKEESEISYEELERGLKWLKGRFKNEWKKLLEEKRRLDENLRKKTGKKPIGSPEISRYQLNICRGLAKLQRNLVFYLFYVSRNEDAPSKLEAKIYEAIFDENNKESIVNCLGEEGRYKVKESLKGVISNLTL